MAKFKRRSCDLREAVTIVSNSSKIIRYSCVVRYLELVLLLKAINRDKKHCSEVGEELLTSTCSTTEIDSVTKMAKLKYHMWTRFE